MFSENEMDEQEDTYHNYINNQLEFDVPMKKLQNQYLIVKNRIDYVNQLCLPKILKDSKRSP